MLKSIKRVWRYGCRGEQSLMWKEVSFGERIWCDKGIARGGGVRCDIWLVLPALYARVDHEI